MRNFKKYFMYLTVLLCFMSGSKAYSQTVNKVHDWTPLINAIIEVESKGNPNAISGKSVGILQITPILVKQCNNILKTKKSSKFYTLNSRKSITKSKEMFILIQEYYNKEHNLEKAIRLWNGGPNYSIKKTQKYFRKVMKYYNNF